MPKNIQHVIWILFWVECKYHDKSCLNAPMQGGKDNKKKFMLCILLTLVVFMGYMVFKCHYLMCVVLVWRS